MENKFLHEIFEKWSNEFPLNIKPLPQSGSYRQYFRVQSKNKTAIAVYNNDYRENLAFVTFSKHFRNIGIPVPEIYIENLNENIYLQQDLGDLSLFDYISAIKNDLDYSEKLINIYKKVIDNLVKIQVYGIKNLDLTKCYPRSEFDRQSIIWDLNYFKYYFLKIAKVPFYEQDLENDFKTFTDFLLQAPNNFFLFRDFQSRNIMISENQPYFIDYQGGRRGALQYDLASLLYDAKINISEENKEILLDYYLIKVNEITDINEIEFKKYFPGFVLIRILQAMGAYGFRGLIERKLHFIQSIPPAIKNLNNIINKYNFSVELPTLFGALKYLLEKSEFAVKEKTDVENFTLEIKSFSYKKGIPENITEHGGGFVFDCRSLPNPGRIEEYKKLSGLDQKTKDYLKAEIQVETFISQIYGIIEKVFKTYLAKKFNYLSINFGCTGGQHRSVYCAEKLSEIIYEEFGIKAIVEHTQKENWVK